MEKNQFFDNPLMRTKITSANVKPKEMILGYFLGPFCAFISNAIFGAYLNRYYSDVLGWTDTAKFGIFSAVLPMVSVIFVILGNLLVGRLIDNTRTSQGKARPYMLLSAPLVTIAIALLFLTPQNGSPSTQMIWIALSYNFYYAVAYPFFYTAHSSMVALSTRNSDHRGVVTFLAILLEYYFTRERVTEENMKLAIKEEKLPMMKQLKACVSNGYWWIIILYFLLFQFGGLVKNGSMSYYSRWMFDGITSEAAAGTAMGTLGLIGGLPTAIGMVLAWPIANKLGKQKAVTIGLAISVVGGLVSFLDIHNFTIVCIGVILKGIGSIPAMYVTLALLSDVLDHLEAKNGFRSDGFTMSVYGAIMVGMTGLGNGLINALLTATGYDASASVQNGGVQSMLALCYLGAEIICYAVIVILMCFLKVEKHIEEDQKTILQHQKKAVLEAGGVWIEPAERLRMEQEEAERMAEEARIEELKAYCKKKGLDFEMQEASYQKKLAEKRAKAEAKARKKQKSQFS